MKNNTVEQSNNATASRGMRSQTIVSDNLCAYGYNEYESFFYTHITAGQPIVSNTQISQPMSGFNGEPRGLACQSLNEST